MAKKKVSLRVQAQRAKKLQEIAWKRMEEKELRVRRANAISDGAMIWVTILMSKLGDRVVITPEEMKRTRELEYLSRRLSDGSVEIVLKGTEGAEEEPDVSDT